MKNFKMATMAATLDIGMEPFSIFKSLCHCDASHQVSAQSDLRFRRRCRLKNYKGPSWISELNNFSNSESSCCHNASY